MYLNLLLFSVTEWRKETMPVLNLAIPMVWEGLGRNVRGSDQKVRAVIIVNANEDPSSFKFNGANRSKVNFIATGSTKLKHSKRMTICKGQGQIFSYIS